MTNLSPDGLSNIVAKANLAPSVHNTQPTRWELNKDGTLRLFLDRTRVLSIGDPERRDASVSLGAAFEGTRLALTTIGLAIKGYEVSLVEGSPEILISTAPSNTADSLVDAIDRRVTWRGGFMPATTKTLKAIQDICEKSGDAVAVVEETEIAWLASFNDEASLDFFRNPSYRAELLEWMRLSKKHENWKRDGLNAQALNMTLIEAIGANIILRKPIFEFCDRLNVARSLISEKELTRSSAAIALFHRPFGEDPVKSGAAFYQLLLRFALVGVMAWPMAVLADSPPHRQAVAHRFNINDNRRVINAFRLGILPSTARPTRIRLPASELFTTA
ncbi:hypothetical protein [Maritalea myrionectae]|uniref:hypothetical protein n=1 Tax=Maritalea myrionectae TaxID=454601 RepID=UPI0004188A1E|nr:hypothetical protein [Maritalea myrionectae]